MSTIDVLAWASRSMTRTFCRRPTDKPYAGIMATVVFPTPPRRLDTAMNVVTEGFPHYSFDREPSSQSCLLKVMPRTDSHTIGSGGSITIIVALPPSSRVQLTPL